MKKLLIIYKTYHVIIILCFFLPFTPIDCNWGPSAEELAQQARLDSLTVDSMAKAYADSIFNLQKDSSSFRYGVKAIANYSNTDSLSAEKDTSNMENNVDSAVETGMNSADTLSLPKDSIEKESRFLIFSSEIITFISTDGNKNFTGIGYLIVYFEGFMESGGSINAFFLIIASTIMVFRKRWRFIKSILLIDIIGFLFLFFCNFHLWGYWLTLYAWIGLLILDFLVIKKSKTVSTS